MKKIVLSVALIVVFAAYVFYQHEQNLNAPPSTFITPLSIADQTAATNPSTAAPAVSAPVTGSATPKTPNLITPPVAQKPSGQYKDGSYTGAAADAFYGNVQVAAIISGGKLADVQILQYPSDRSHSLQLSQMALPRLKSEAIAAQNANVQIISGATDTSQAFTQSLQSALNQAKA
jgi:uncharacterized protein with FMN-binding domain